jgi:hypothetical protein
LDEGSPIRGLGKGRQKDGSEKRYKD